VPHVKRCYRRHVQKARVLALPLDTVVCPRKRFAELVRDVLVELEILALADLAARTGPERFRLVDGFGVGCADLQLHGERDVIGVLPDQRADAVRLEELCRVVPKKQLDRGARLGLRTLLDGELTLPVGLPRDTRL